MPFAQLLSLEGAVRHADYSHAGQATSWKAGAIWEPTDGLRLRATISRAIRAPNIFEAFRPSEGQTTNVEDPCRSEEHTSELQSLMRISYAVFCLKKKKQKKKQTQATHNKTLAQPKKQRTTYINKITYT